MISSGMLLEGEVLNNENLEGLEDIGHFDVVSEALRISDPCYDRDVWCSGSLEPVKNGRWHASVQRVDLDGWGNRVSKLVAVHKHHIARDLEFCLSRIDVGVDSGQAGIFDNAHYKDDDAITKDDFGDHPWNSQGAFYSACGSHTLSKKAAGCLKYGAVSSSGIGDGGYSCFAAVKDGLVVGVVIDFLLGPEHDSDEDDEDVCDECHGEGCDDCDEED